MTTLDKILANYGVVTTPTDGWETRNSPGGTDWIGLMIHHTGSHNSSVHTLTDGRADLPGPLCHYYTEELPDPKTWLICDIDANANHAGPGDPKVLERVRNDEPPQPPTDKLDKDRVDGNGHFLGDEIEGATPGDLGDARYQVAVLSAAAICDHYGWDPLTRVIGHKEWTTRKVDPAFDMDLFRDHVVNAIKEHHMPPIPDDNLPPEFPPRGWADGSWTAYVAAGGSTVPESRDWLAFREDIAWFHQKFIAPLEARVAVLEAIDNPTGPSGAIVSGDIVQIFRQEKQ